MQQWSTAERALLQSLEAAINDAAVVAKLEPLVAQVEARLAQDPAAVMAYEPVPLEWYGKELPEPIRSSWVFILRARTNTGAERHPNSQQRMAAYRGTGDMQVWRAQQWQSTVLKSEVGTSLADRWVSIPVNVWHQVVVPENNWVVVSFHTVPAAELIEERPEQGDMEMTQQRRYLDNLHKTEKG
jgi:hypothetical protein